jgi:hypothetical protein
MNCELEYLTSCALQDGLWYGIQGRLGLAGIG